MVDAGLFHTGDHTVSTEIAECRVIYLDVACRHVLNPRLKVLNGNYLRQPNAYNSAISSR